MKQDKAFEKLKKSFVADLEEKVKLLQNAIDSRDLKSAGFDWETIGRISHQVRGTANSFGFSEISAAADELEQSVAKKSTEDVTKLVRRLSDLSRLAL